MGEWFLTVCLVLVAFIWGVAAGMELDRKIERDVNALVDSALQARKP
jgi:hypothetical protein